MKKLIYSVLQQGTFHIRTSEYSSSGLVLVSFFILPDDQKCHEIRDNSFIKNFSTKRRKELKYRSDKPGIFSENL